jgi:hypothetical protein
MGTMAIADPAFNIADLPAEGRTLSELIERMVSREAWRLLTTFVGDRPPPRVSYPRSIYLAAKYIEGDNDYTAALRSCLPLIDAWNAGVLIAKGRRGSPLAPLEEIPPPRVGWTMEIASLLQSRIIEPGTLLKDRRSIYDLRFYSASVATLESGKVAVTPKPLPAKKWIEAAANRLKASPDCPKGITEAACRLHDEMKAAHKQSECKKVLVPRSIENVLRAGFFAPAR